MRKRYWTLCFLFFCIIFLANQAAAETQAACPPLAAVCPSTAGPINTDTAIPVAKGTFVLNPVYFHALSYGAFGPDWQTRSAGGRYLNSVFGLRFYYGAAQNLEIYGIIPVVYNYAYRVGPDNQTADFFGMGDIQLFCKYQFLQESDKAPAVSAILGFGFPTGHYRRLNPDRLGTDLLGSGSYRFTVGLNASKYIAPFIFYGNVWYTMATDYSTNAPGPYVRVHPRDQVAVNFAVEWPFARKWTACLDYTSYFDAGRLIGRKANTSPGAKITLTPELQFKATEKFTIAGGVGFDIAGKNAGANITPQLSFYYVFR